MNEFIERYRLGDWADIAGFVVGVIGFAITIIAAIKSKRAAQRAEIAANAAHRAIGRSHSIQDLSTAVATLEEVKRLQREEAWAIVPDRYATAKKLLVTVRAAAAGLDDGHQQRIQAVIQQLGELELQVEQSNQKDKAKLNVAKLNDLVSQQIDTLQELLVRVRERIGSSDGD